MVRVIFTATDPGIIGTMSKPFDPTSPETPISRIAGWRTEAAPTKKPALASEPLLPAVDAVEDEDTAVDERPVQEQNVTSPETPIARTAKQEPNREPRIIRGTPVQGDLVEDDREVARVPVVRAEKPQE
jgi:hypothetical protein